MAASKGEISWWFDEGVKAAATHLIVVCDTFDHEDYPVYCSSPEECRKQYESHDGRNMQRVMEIYDLQRDKKSQMDAARAFYLP